MVNEIEALLENSLRRQIGNLMTIFNTPDGRRYQ